MSKYTRKYTKEMARADAIKKWTRIIKACATLGGRKNLRKYVIGPCGFCKFYFTKYGGCNNCPLYRLEHCENWGDGGTTYGAIYMLSCDEMDEEDTEECLKLCKQMLYAIKWCRMDDREVSE
jgi:hypothetical protein